jgi:hypothetical protein
MAVNNCRPNSTRSIAIAFETFGMARVFYGISKLFFRKALDQSPSEKTNDMSWNFSTGRLLVFWCM